MKKRLSVLAFAGTVATLSAQATPNYFYNTTQSEIEYNFGGPLSDKSPSQSIVVPNGQTWDITDMTADIGEGSQANLSFNFFDSGANLVGSTSATSLDILYAFVNVNFPANITLTPGTYNIVPDYQVTGEDDGSYWSYNTTAGALALSLSGALTPTPEPSTLALAGLGIAGLVAARRRK
jgi:hypothetical protein